jgi:predicted dehydrogenase
VRLGIVSTAEINRKVIPGALESPEVELVAVASRSQDKADAYARKWGIPKAHGSYEALLEDPEVDAVYISLPNSLHVEWSVRALEAGKHVLCEKPLDRRPAEVERAFDAADGAGRILMEAFMYRHHPQTSKLMQLIDDGAIGDLRLVKSSFSFPLHDRQNVRARPELDGGGLMDVGCYCVSGSRLLGGEPATAAGRSSARPESTCASSARSSSRATCSRPSTAASTCLIAAARWRRSARRARCASRARGTASSPG